MAHLNFKVTRWEKLHIPDEMVNDVIEKLKSSDVDEVYELMELSGIYHETTTPDEAAEEPMLIEENENCSTQELYNSEGNIIYKNGIADDE